MAEDFKNKIQRLELENFTCFAKAEMDFSSGINVFKGGKSGFDALGSAGK